jgi:putative Mg2+ transporter-C (MgtC) family protein
MLFLAESAPPLATGTILGRLLLALFFGSLVGIDRQLHHKAAGLRTQMLVCLGACAFAMVPVLFRTSAGDAMATADISRVIQGIVGGIGFLGAGVVVHYGTRTLGITTAAAIWTTAAIGVAIGLGEYCLAIFAGGLTVLTLALVGIIEKRAFQDDKHKDEVEGESGAPAPSNQMRPTGATQPPPSSQHS